MILKKKQKIKSWKKSIINKKQEQENLQSASKRGNWTERYLIKNKKERNESKEGGFRGRTENQKRRRKGKQRKFFQRKRKKKIKSVK